MRSDSTGSGRRWVRGSRRSHARYQVIVNAGFVPYAGEVQANVSPTAAARLDTLSFYSASNHKCRNSDTGFSVCLMTGIAGSQKSMRSVVRLEMRQVVKMRIWEVANSDRKEGLCLVGDVEESAEEMRLSSVLDYWAVIVVRSI